MPERNYPGVYIEERSSGPGPIQGVSTSNLGLIGFSKKGPTNQPILVTSFQEFTAKFGDFTAASLAPTEAFAFFQNGGSTLYFVRVVHEADAVKARCFLTKEVQDMEVVEGDSAATYSFSLPKTPVVPHGSYGPSPYTLAASLVLTTTDGEVVPKIGTFTDNGDGTFTITGTGGFDDGVDTTGSIDYETGEVYLTFGTPADFPAGQFLTASWVYETFHFDLKWSGLAGNSYRVVVSGTPDYYVAATASYQRFDVTIDEYVEKIQGWNTIETYQGVVLDDASSPQFIATVMNDLNAGSEIAAVVAYNRELPPELAGTHYAAKDVSSSPVYNGANKEFVYLIGTSVAKTTLAMQFGFKHSPLPIITTIPLITDTTWAWAPATSTQLHPNTSAAKTSVAAGVLVSFTLDGDGAKIAGDDGAGNLKLVIAGNCTGAIVGTVNYLTGALSLDVSGLADTFDGVAAVRVTQLYYGPVVIDDGNGNLSLQRPCGTYALNSNGTNRVDYTTGACTLTWKIAGNPAAGPTADTYPAQAPITKAQTATYYTQPGLAVVEQFFGGADGSALDRSDVTGATLVADYKGLYAFDQVDAIMSLVVADFQTDELVCSDVIDYCMLRKDKFAIFTAPEGLEPQEAVNWKKFTLSRFTKYAAVYYPHIRVIDPVTQAAINLPCGGHVAGRYAATDINKNVGKAPAGTGDGALSWQIGLERDLTPAQVGVCYQDKLNCLVSWPATGRVIWGARTLDIAGGEWPYIQMTRLFQFVEKSVFNATHVHVFENNGPQLWGRVKLQLDTFLLGLFQQNYFAGTSPKEAFFVICDKTNNPQNTVDQGLMFVDVGLAPNKPAEFVVFRFSQRALV
jgi:phage tail sheath protein FI